MANIEVWALRVIADKELIMVSYSPFSDIQGGQEQVQIKISEEDMPDFCEKFKFDSSTGDLEIREEFWDGLDADEKILAPDVEVSIARGIEESLDARLETEHGEDGKHTKDGAGGWHGSSTRIKILPSAFISDGGPDFEIVADGGGSVTTLGADTGLLATVPIPIGFKATHVRIFADTLKTVNVDECQIDDLTNVYRGTGNTTAEIDMEDVAATSTNYLSIWVPTVNGAKIYGGYVTIAPI